MAIRVVRHMAGWSLPADDSRLLAVIPYGAGEDLQHMRIDAYAATKADSYADQANEINWYALAVPWSILLTHATTQYESGASHLDSSDEWQTMFRQLLFEFGTDGNEFYGGEGVVGSADDVIGEPDMLPGTGDDHGQDEPWMDRGTKGPIGVRRLFAREVLMRPLLAEGSGKIRWFDDFNTTVDGPTGHQSGGVVLAGAIRYETGTAESNFNAQLQEYARKGLGPLIGGDLSRVQWILRGDTGSVGDHLRTIMFGGDNYIEADSFKTDTAKIYMKIWASFQTPYTLDVL